MRLKVVVVDLELSRRQKRACTAALALAGAFAASVALADVPKTFVAGETLKAADLNANFDDHEGRLSELQENQAQVDQHLTAIDTNNANLQPQIVARLTSGAGTLPAGSNSTIVGGSVDTSSTQMMWQSASAVQYTDANGEVAISFPTPFPNGVTSVIVSNGEEFTALPAQVFGTLNGSTTLNGFVVRVRQGGNGGVIANQILRFNWIAVGW